MAESWQYIIGLLFVITILFFKGGIVGIVKDQIPALIQKCRRSDLKEKKQSHVLAGKEA